MWTYEGQEFTEDMIGKSVGFVYKITSLTDSRMYIGKKLFTKAKTIKKKGKRTKRSRIASDWTSYYGSNKELQEDVQKLGPENFQRIILRLCATRAEMSYYETKLIFETDALLRADYYNSWVSVRVTRAHMSHCQPV